MNIELEWTRPTNTYGELLGYKLRYGIRGQEMFDIMMTETKRRISDLGMCSYAVAGFYAHRNIIMCTISRTGRGIRISYIRSKRGGFRSRGHRVLDHAGRRSHRSAGQRVLRVPNARRGLRGMGRTVPRTPQRTDHPVRRTVPQENRSIHHHAQKHNVEKGTRRSHDRFLTTVRIIRCCLPRRCSPDWKKPPSTW